MGTQVTHEQEFRFTSGSHPPIKACLCESWADGEPVIQVAERVVYVASLHPSSPFISQARRSLWQRAQRRWQNRHNTPALFWLGSIFRHGGWKPYLPDGEPPAGGSVRRCASTLTKALGTPTPGMGIREDSSFYPPHGDRSGGGAMPPTLLRASSPIVLGSSGNETEDPGANGEPPERVDSADVIAHVIVHLIALAGLGGLHANDRCPTCAEARRIADYPPDWGLPGRAG